MTSALPRGGGAGRRLLAVQIVAPVRVGAVEIGFDQPRALLVGGAALAQQGQQIGAAQLVEPHAGEAALQHRAGHRAGVVVEAHADKRRLDLELLPAAGPRRPPSVECSRRNSGNRPAASASSIASRPDTTSASTAAAASAMPPHLTKRASRSGSALTNSQPEQQQPEQQHEAAEQVQHHSRSCAVRRSTSPPFFSP